jgi:hypothetical protein
VPFNFRATVYYALNRRNLSLLLFKLSEERPSFFHHLGDLALLSLGIAIQQPVRLRMQYRYAFLLGLTADIPLVQSGQWKQPLEGKQEQKEAKANRRQIKELKRELRRKEKALAETSALLVLRKKLKALREETDGEDD